MIRGRVHFIGAYGYVTDGKGHLAGRLMSLAARGAARDGAEVECAVEAAGGGGGEVAAAAMASVPDRVCLQHKFDEVGVPRFSFDQLMLSPPLAVARVLRQSRNATLEVGLALRNFRRKRAGAGAGPQQPQRIELAANNETRLAVPFDDGNTCAVLIARLQRVFEGNEFQAQRETARRFEVSPLDNLAHGSVFDNGFHAATRLVEIVPPKTDKELLLGTVDRYRRSLADVFPECDPWGPYTPHAWPRDGFANRGAVSHQDVVWLAVDSSADCVAEGAFAVVRDGEELLLCVSCPAPWLAGEENEALARAVVHRKRAVYLTPASPEHGVLRMMPPGLIERCRVNLPAPDAAAGSQEEAAALALVLVFSVTLQAIKDKSWNSPYLATIDRTKVQCMSYRQFEVDPMRAKAEPFAAALRDARLGGGESGFLSLSAASPSVDLVFGAGGVPDRLVQLQDGRARGIVEEFALAVSRITAETLDRHGLDMLLSSQSPPEGTALANFARRVLRRAPAMTTAEFVGLNRRLHAKPPGALTAEEVIQAAWMGRLLSPSYTSLYCPRRFDGEPPVGNFAHGLRLSAPASGPLRNVRDLFNQGQLLRVIARAHDADPHVDAPAPAEEALPDRLVACDGETYVVVPSSIRRPAAETTEPDDRTANGLVPRALEVVPRPDFVADINHLASACKQISRTVKGVEFSIALSKHGFLTNAIVQSVTPDCFSLVDFRTHFECKITYESIRHLLCGCNVDEAVEAVDLLFRYGDVPQVVPLHLAAHRSLVRLVIGATATDSNYSFTPRSIHLGGDMWLPLAQTQANAASLFHHRPFALPPLDHTFRTCKLWAQQFAHGELEELIQVAVTGGEWSADPARRKARGSGKEPVAGYHRLVRARFCGQQDIDGVRPQLCIPSIDRDFAEKLFRAQGCVAVIFAPSKTNLKLPRRLGSGTIPVDCVEDVYLLPACRTQPSVDGKTPQASIVLDIPAFSSLSRAAQHSLPKLCEGTRPVRVLLYSVAQQELSVVRFLHDAILEKRPLKIADAYPALFAAEVPGPTGGAASQQPGQAAGSNPIQALQQRFSGKPLPQRVVGMLESHLSAGCGSDVVSLDEKQRLALFNMFHEPFTVLNGSGGTGKSTVQALAITALALCDRDCRGGRTSLAVRASTLVVCEKNMSVHALAEKTEKLNQKFGLGLKIGWYAAFGETEHGGRLTAGIQKSEKLNELSLCDVLLCTCTNANKLCGQLTRENSARLDYVFVDEVTTVRESRQMYLLEQVLATHKIGRRNRPALLSIGGDLNQSRPFTSANGPSNSGISWLERFAQRYLCPETGTAPPRPVWSVALTTNYRVRRRGLVIVQSRMGCDVTVPSGELEGDVNPRLPAVWMWDVDGTDFTRNVGHKQLKDRDVDLGLLNATSVVNLEEVDAVIALVRVLVRTYQVQPSDILVISPYTNHLLVIEHYLARESLGVQCLSCLNNSGNEAEVVILSFARSSRTASHEPKGYLDASHLRTALMRPRESLFIIGDRKWLSDNHKWGASTMVAAVESVMETQQRTHGPPPPEIPRCTAFRPQKLCTPNRRGISVHLVERPPAAIPDGLRAMEEELPQDLPPVLTDTDFPLLPSRGVPLVQTERLACLRFPPPPSPVLTPPVQRTPVVGGVIVKTAKTQAKARKEQQSTTAEPSAVFTWSAPMRHNR